MANKKNEQIKKNLEVRSKNVRQAKKVVEKASYEKTEDKITKTYNLLINKNRDKIFVSRKRQIFESWHQAVKQQKHFVFSVINICTKSAYSQGFEVLRDFDKYKAHKNKKERLLTKYFGRFNANFMKDAITRWKKCILMEASSELSLVSANYADTLGNFSEKMTRIKDQNMANCEHHFKKLRRNRVWFAWQKARQYAKMKAFKKEDGPDVLKAVK